MDLKTLQQRELLILKTLTGRITRRHAGYDAGYRGCVAYLWRKRDNVYTEIQLDGGGDYQFDNNTQAARELAAWVWGVLGPVLEGVAAASVRKFTPSFAGSVSPALLHLRPGELAEQIGFWRRRREKLPYDARGSRA